MKLGQPSGTGEAQAKAEIAKAVNKARMKRGQQNEEEAVASWRSNERTFNVRR